MLEDLDAPGPASRQDAAALVGLVAVLEGELLTGNLTPYTVEQLCRCFEQDGLLAARPGPAELRLALANLNQRLRVTLGEQDEPIEPNVGYCEQYFGFATQTAARDFAAAARAAGKPASGPAAYDYQGYNEPVSWQVVIGTTELVLTPEFDEQVQQLTVLAQQYDGLYGGWSG